MQFESLGVRWHLNKFGDLKMYFESLGTHMTPHDKFMDRRYILLADIAPYIFFAKLVTNLYIQSKSFWTAFESRLTIWSDLVW